MPIGRIDLHTHLLPNVDDGCKSYAESVSCARTLVENGYTHAVCSPHIWPSLPGNTVDAIREKVELLQGVLNEAAVPLELLPGGELNLVALWPAVESMARDAIPTIGFRGETVLFDFWSDSAPEALTPAVRCLQRRGFTLILAHPERIGAFRLDPGLLDRVADLGVRFQLNSWCLVEPIGSVTRQLAEQWLQQDRYFLMATDLHNPGGLATRMQGIGRAVELVGESKVRALVETVPRQLLDL